MQVGHMQLFSKNWTPTLPIGSFREGVATDVPTLLLGSQSGRRIIGTASVDTFSLEPPKCYWEGYAEDRWRCSEGALRRIGQQSALDVLVSFLCPIASPPVAVQTRYGTNQRK
jgi:hypothetical protein